MLRVKSIGGERGHWRDGRYFDREWSEVESLTAAQLADPRIQREEIVMTAVEHVHARDLPRRGRDGKLR